MTYRIQSHDGTREHRATKKAALAWARTHLRNWMEPGDTLRTWQTDTGRTVLAVGVDGELTEAHVLIGKVDGV